MAYLWASPSGSGEFQAVKSHAIYSESAKLIKALQVEGGWKGGDGGGGAEGSSAVVNRCEGSPGQICTIIFAWFA